MFDLKIHDFAREFRLDVSGELDGAAARQLYMAWHTGLSTVGSRPVVVRLRDVRLGQEGAEVLALLHGRHAELVATDENTAAHVAAWIHIRPRVLAHPPRRLCERLCGIPLLHWWCCRQTA